LFIALISVETLMSPIRCEFHATINGECRQTGRQGVNGGRYRSHMQKEDRDLFPAALEPLTSEDWQALDRIASGQPDPLSGPPFGKRFAKLRAEILDPRNAASVAAAEA